MDDDRRDGRTPGGALTLARLAGAGMVGLVLTVLAVPALIALLFGAWAVGATLTAVSAAVSVVGLSLVYRCTAGRGHAVRWAVGVAAGGTVLAAAGAAAWWLSGHEFGRYPLLWQAALAAAFVVAAGIGTRAVRLPAALVAGVAALVMLAVLVPRALAWLPEPDRRGCIASSAEEAARNCS